MASTEPISISPGDVVDGFEVVDVLASGATSTTFRARHAALGREVALKFLHPAVFGDDDALELARADAGRVARVEHPSIAAVFAAGEHRGGLYVASALPQGSTLAELTAERAITAANVTAVVVEVADALEAAHAQHVVHRDLRPECITVDRWGHGVVRDFGVTRTSGRTGVLTRAEVLDALRYTAPEIIIGREATPATDVFGLAATAVWCLTGVTPYPDRPPAEYVLMRAQAAPPTLVRPDGGRADELDMLLEAAMAVDPAVRPRPLEFARALEAAVQRLPATLRDRAAPLERAQAGAAPVGVPVVTGTAGSDVTRVEHRRPPPRPALVPARGVPWTTYAVCATTALAAGVGGLAVGRAAAPRASEPVRIGAFDVPPGPTWVIGTSSGGGALSLSDDAGRTATVGAVGAGRLPGDPLPPALTGDGVPAPRPATAGRMKLVAYRGAGGIVVARPTTAGTLYAACSPDTPAGRCAALVTRAAGAGRARAVAPLDAVATALRTATTASESAIGIAAGEFGGPRSQHAASAARLAFALRKVATELKVDRVDAGTTAAVARVRDAIAAQAAAYEDFGSALNRRSNVAADAARERAGVARRRLVAALEAFRRAGYRVVRASRGG